jgi:hypothetical protein
MSRSSIVWRIIGILVLLAVLAVAGTFVYQAGYAQGVAHSALVTSASSGSAPAPAPMPYPYYGYYPGMWMNPFFGFFPFGCLIGFFLICLFFFAMRMIFFPHRWGRRGWRHHGYGPWGGPPWEDDGPGGEGQGKAQPGPTRTA